MRIANRRKKSWFSKVCLLAGLACAALAVLAAVYLRGEASRRVDPVALEYYRSVLVLQTMVPRAAEEKEEIPPQMRHHDSTESLLHHSDDIFRLRAIASSLREVGSAYPRARLFEAYARLGLGEKDTAAALLSAYVAESPYEPRQYGLLCELLQESGDAAALYLITQEWLDHDSSCREDRLLYTWVALSRMGRHRDAALLMEGGRSCMGWRAALYSARSLLALGDEKGGEEIIRKTAGVFADARGAILLEWQRMKGRADF